MSIQPYFPTINLAQLATISTLRQQMETHEDYLKHPDCPYDQSTREQIARLLTPKVVEVPVEVEKIVEKIVEKRVEVMVAASEGGGKRGAKPKPKGSGVNQDEVAKEIADLRSELKQLKIDGKALQTGDKIQMIKLRASLVEKMIQMDERTNNLKKQSLFMSVVMSILDDLMDDERRHEFLKRLEPFAAAE